MFAWSIFNRETGSETMPLLELTLILVVIWILTSSRAFREWSKKISLDDRRFAAVIIVAIIWFHLLDVSRNTFPFVRWSMYASHYEPEEIKWGKVRAKLQNGESVWINPVKQFPSLSRNFCERFGRLVEAADNNELTPAGEKVYRDLLQSIANKYNHRHPENPVVEVWSSLQTIEVENCQTSIREHDIPRYFSLP